MCSKKLTHMHGKVFLIAVLRLLKQTVVFARQLILF